MCMSEMLVYVVEIPFGVSMVQRSGRNSLPSAVPGFCARLIVSVLAFVLLSCGDT